MAEQGSKAGRRERHLRAERDYKERKAIRKRRARIHRAMDQVDQIRERRKKGVAERDKIMLELGFERVGVDGKGLAPEQKWQEVDHAI